MHSYSTDGSKVRVYSLMAVGAVLISFAATWATSGLNWPVWIVSTPSLAASFSIEHAIFDRWLWRKPIFRTIGLVNVRDVSGKYNGRLISTYRDMDGHQVKRNIGVRIEQTWSQIEVTMTVESGESSSRSQSAVASVSNRSGGTRLVYVYFNQVNPGIADADMGDHQGAADIEISPDGSMTGRYFNARPNAGTIIAKLGG